MNHFISLIISECRKSSGFHKCAYIFGSFYRKVTKLFTAIKNIIKKHSTKFENYRQTVNRLPSVNWRGPLGSNFIPIQTIGFSSAYIGNYRRIESIGIYSDIDIFREAIYGAILPILIVPNLVGINSSDIIRILN